MSAPAAAVVLATLALVAGNRSVASNVAPAAADGSGPLRVASWPLDSTTELALVEDHRAPLVALRIAFPAGTWSPWFRHTDVEDGFAIQLYDPKGTLRRRADALGVSLSLESGSRASTLTASCLKDDLPALLDLIQAVLANSDFDRDELRRWGHAQRLEWDAAQKDPDFRASQAVARALFSKDDPRRRDYESPEPVDRDVARLGAARDELIRAPGRTIAFAGDLTRDEATRAATDLLPRAGTVARADATPEFGPITADAERPRAIEIPIPRLTQVYFSLARETIPVTDADYPAYVIANHVLGGHFYSRLYRALRHEGGDTYGAGSGGSTDTVRQVYALYTFTRADNAPEVDAKLRATLRTFHEQGITEAERAEAASYLLGHRPFLRETPAQVLRRWMFERELGVPPGFLSEIVESATVLPLEDVNRFIAKFHDPAKFTMVRVRPK